MPSLAKQWLHAARPKTFLITLSPILLGTVFAAGFNTISLGNFFWTLFAALFIQVGTHFSNDFFDYLKQADTDKRKGAFKLLERKIILPYQMIAAFIAMYIMAVLCSLPLYFQIGNLIFFLCFFSIFFSLLYTATPVSLAYTGAADLFVFLFYGPIATVCSFYIQTLSISFDVLIASFGPGALSVIPLIINNIRDIEEDRLANKRTLIVRFGTIFGKLEYITLHLIAAVVPFALYLFSNKSIALLFSLAPFILAFQNFQMLRNYQDPKELNKALPKSVLVLFLYTSLLTLFIFL